MRPTRRAVVLVALCVLAFWLAAASGGRSLNAVFVSVLIALCAAIVQLVLTECPTVERSQPEPGFPDDTRTGSVDIETDDPLTARIEERVGDGLRAKFSSLAQGLPTTVEYEIELENRGEDRLEPLTLTVRDVFGLVTRTFQDSKRAPFLTYPAVYDLTGETSALSRHEEIIDELREYVRGHGLRDVYWKSSAKRNDLGVMEFDSETHLTSLTVATKATPAHADEMASATVSVTTHLLGAGRAIALELPNGRVEHTDSEPQQERVLSAFTRTGSGRVEAGEANIHILADASDIHITIEDREIPFERLTNQLTTVTAAGGSES